MKKSPGFLTLFLLCNLGAACSSGDSSPADSTATAGSAGSAGLGGGAANSSTAGTAGSGGTTATGTGAGGSTAGAGGSGSTTPATGAAGTTQLSGTLGDLGPVQPTVSSLVISNSGETLIYMSSAPITCDLLSMSRWLGSVAAGSQVVEIVVPSTTTTGEVAVQEGGAEVNYAPGGKSSAYEQNADSGNVTFTTNTPKGVVEGTVTATYTNPAGNVSGSFHAEFCAGGQGY